MAVPPGEFIEHASRVIKLVRAQRALPAQMEAVVALAKRLVPACDVAGLSLVIAGEASAGATADRVVLEIDLVQYQTGRAPTLGSMARSNIVRVDLIEHDSCFERFAPGAVDAGINSIVSFPLVANQKMVGAIDLYSFRPNAFDSDTEGRIAPIVRYTGDTLSMSALYASALGLVEVLVASVEDRAVIAQATGFLMARNDWTSTEAIGAIRDRAVVQRESLADSAKALLPR